jgi:hypothetical protein
MNAHLWPPSPSLSLPRTRRGTLHSFFAASFSSGCLSQNDSLSLGTRMLSLPSLPSLHQRPHTTIFASRLPCPPRAQCYHRSPRDAPHLIPSPGQPWCSPNQQKHTQCHPSSRTATSAPGSPVIGPHLSTEGVRIVVIRGAPPSLGPPRAWKTVL